MKSKAVNKSIYDRVAIDNQVSPKQVEEIINFVGGFTRQVIERGVFETVMLPKFGKIKAKAKKVQWDAHSKVMPKLPI